MKRYSRKKRVFLISVSLLLILAILAILLVTARCTRDDGTGTTTTGTPGTAAATPGPSTALAAKDSTAVIVAPEDIDLRSNFNSLTEDRPSAYPNCVGSVLIYVASGPGKPAVNKPVLQAAKNDTLFAGKISATLANLSTLSLIRATLPIRTLPPTPTPVPVVQVTGPAAGTVLTAGSPFVLHVTVNSGRTVKINVLLSIDGGRTFTEIVTGMDYAPTVDLVIPDWISSTCVFRVDAYAGTGTAKLGSGLSPAFKIAARPTLTPIPTLTPTPSVSPDLHYGPASRAFVASDGDPTRWFLMDIQA
ncbi:MAG TPA: hypothetical protein VIL27_09180, partial [Clostridia bacterium]